VIYLSSLPFEDLGFKTDLQGSPYPPLTWAILNKVPNVVTLGAVFFGGLWWLTKRKNEIALGLIDDNFEENHVEDESLHQGDQS
jgi:hypothetical protein